MEFSFLQIGRNGYVRAGALFFALRPAQGPDRYERYAALEEGQADIEACARETGLAVKDLTTTTVNGTVASVHPALALKIVERLGDEAAVRSFTEIITAYRGQQVQMAVQPATFEETDGKAQVTVGTGLTPEQSLLMDAFDKTATAHKHAVTRLVDITQRNMSNVHEQAHRALIDQQAFELRTRQQIIRHGYILKNGGHTTDEAHGAFPGDEDQQRMLEGPCSAFLKAKGSEGNLNPIYMAQLAKAAEQKNGDSEDDEYPSHEETLGDY